MMPRHLQWEYIVNTKTKRSTVISVLRWTLLQHVTKSLDQIHDEYTKKMILCEEMSWLNQYWGQQIPNSSISSKYWQRIFTMKSLDTRRELYQYLFGEELRRAQHQLRKEKKRQELIIAMSNFRQLEIPYHKTIFNTLEIKFNRKRWHHFNVLACAARLGEYFIIDGSFEYAHSRHSYFSSLVQRVFRCFKYIDHFHSPAYIIISDLSSNFKPSNFSISHKQSNYFHSTQELYIDLFDKDRLIYLTPDSPNEMTHYDHDSVYILGGIYDDENKEALTYEKAVRQNIRHQKLPLDKYLRLISFHRIEIDSHLRSNFSFHTASSHALAFHEVYNILLTLKHTNNNWKQALRFVPTRKVVTRFEEQIAYDEDHAIQSSQSC